MEHLDAKSGDFLILNPLNPPYQGDFKRKCGGFPKYLSNSRFYKTLQFSSLEAYFHYHSLLLIDRNLRAILKIVKLSKAS